MPKSNPKTSAFKKVEPGNLATVWDSVILVVRGSARRIDSLVEIDGATYTMCVYRQKDNVVRVDLKSNPRK